MVLKTKMLQEELKLNLGLKMKNPSTNSKSSWQDEIVLKTSKQRKWIEYLVEKKQSQESKFSMKFIKFLKKIF